jgi:putative transposase
MNALVPLSTRWRFPPTSSSLSFSDGCALSYVCETWPNCFLERGFVFMHETVRDWDARFAPLMADQLRIMRRGQAGTSCSVDETYRHASMASGALSIEPLTGMAIWLMRDGVEKQDRAAAQQFFKQAMALGGHAPEDVTTDGHRSYPRAIRAMMEMWESIGRMPL